MEKNFTISETEAKTKSQFIREALGFVNYEKTEIEGTNKAFLVIAVDPDAVSDDAAMSLGVIGGNRHSLFTALAEYFTTESPIRDLLRGAATMVAMRDMIDIMKNKE